MSANTYEIRQIGAIDTKNIKLGKTFKYGDNYNLTNIYYVPATSNALIPKENDSKRQDSQDDKTKLIIQTPLMYVPNSIVYFNDKPFLELSFNNAEHDSEIATFKEWVQALEDYIYKLIRRRTSLKIEKTNMVSILKSGYRNISSKLVVPINLNVSKCVLSDDGGKRNKFLFNWEIPVPTYGVSIIWVKNVWQKGGKWGINLFMYASRVMNSHILDPIDFIGGAEGGNKSIKTIDVIKHFAPCEKMSITVGNVPEFTTYFRMLRMGIPPDAVKQKMQLCGIDTRIIDYPETTPYATVLHYLANPNLPPYLKLGTGNSTTGLPLGPVPPAPPPPIPLMNSLNGTNNNNTVARANLLSAINSGNFKLRKVDENSQDNTKKRILDKLANQNSGILVPSLEAIQGALAKLKKVDMD